MPTTYLLFRNYSCKIGHLYYSDNYAGILGAGLNYSSEPQKAHLTGEFVIVAKFGGDVLRHLAFRACECDQAGREADLITRNGLVIKI